jgi:hypothetical protein
MSKHNEAPWDVLDLRLMGSETITIACSEGAVCRIRNTVSRKTLNEQDVSNAKLMSKSPDMYRILKGLMDSIECYEAMNRPFDQWDEYDHIMLPKWQEAKKLLDLLDAD